MFHDSKDICPMLIWWLHIVYWTIQNVMTVRDALIIAYLKIPPYPTNSDYYSLAINSTSWVFQSFIYFRLVLFAGVNVINKSQMLIKLLRASRFFCFVNVSFEDIFNHLTKYFLKCVAWNRNRHMLASVSSQCKNCQCT